MIRRELVSKEGLAFLVIFVMYYGYVIVNSLA